MKTISRTFDDALDIKKRRGHYYLYICIDIHGTIITPEYNKENEGARFYDHVLDVLKYLSDREDVILILWSSSYITPASTLIDQLYAQYGIIINFYNENPMEKNNDICDFGSKFYFSVLIDDKAGFDPKNDWLELKNFFNIA